MNDPIRCSYGFNYIIPKEIPIAEIAEKIKNRTKDWTWTQLESAFIAGIIANNQYTWEEAIKRIEEGFK